MRPLIGISQALDERGRWHPRREYAYLDTSYAVALTQSGATPILLPIQDDAGALAQRLDGLLIPGGDDFPPPRPYPAQVRFETVPPRQLAFDQALLAAAFARRLPVLAICYGMQLLALQRGGKLVYDIPSDLPRAGAHSLPEGDGHHALSLEPGSQLARLLGEAPGPVNSHHHQGVAEAGRGQRVCARAEDGLIEAIESADGGFCIGVQWHPERMQGPHRERLFSGFVEACRAGARGGA
jgi:gamma-glutamyl-gamma-aminobutyrate hydrolase PuuD